MNCPKCGKDNILVIDSVDNTDSQERYRKKRCASCQHIFYTTEFEVSYNETLKKEWNKFYRKNSKT